MSFDWKSALGSVAPLIGSAIGGPFGVMAAKFGVEALGLIPEPGNEEQQLEDAVRNMTAEQAIKLKTANQSWKVQMRELDIKEDQLHAADRNSARDMAKANMLPQMILASIYTIAYGVVLYCFMTGKLSVPEDQKILFGSLIGILSGAQIQILNFFFGSTSGSKDKTAAMANGMK